MSQRNIAIIGGSFNPPTYAHIKLIQMATKLDYDKIIIAPVYQHPFDKDLVEIDHRINMLVTVVDLFKLNHKGNIEVSDIEEVLYKEHGSNYTLDLVNYFFVRDLCPIITLVVGSDTIEQLFNWHNYEKLCKMVNFQIMPRKSDVSSTAVRQTMNATSSYRQWLTGLIPDELIDYIEENKLYNTNTEELKDSSK